MQTLPSERPATTPAARTAEAAPTPSEASARGLRRILLGTAGTAAGRDAAVTAMALAHRHDADLRVLSVFHPRVPYPHAREGHATPQISPSDRTAADAQLAAVRQQLREIDPMQSAGAVSMSVGHVGERISEAAAATHADLVVIGNGRASAKERHLGNRGAMAIAACLATPLLAVATGFTGRARRVLVTVGADGGAAAAATLAVRALPEPEVVFLAHVAPPAATAGGATNPASEDESACATQMEAVRRALVPWRAARIVVPALSGDPVERILQLAREQGVDLIIGGVHGATFDERVIIRNVTMRLLAEGECSVLLVPLDAGSTAPKA